MFTKLTTPRFIKRLRLLCATFVLFAVGSSHLFAQDTLRFDFGDTKKSDHFIKVSPADTLKTSAWYGFHNSNDLQAKRTAHLIFPKMII